MGNLLDSIFNPKNVALIGASSREGSVGFALLKNLTKESFPGRIYYVNPKRKYVKGRKCYSSISKIAAKIDLAIIATPSKKVPGIVSECGKSGVRGLLIISSGFMEAGIEGQKITEDILTISRKYNMRVVGPNCLGIIIPALKFNASFSHKMASPGKIAFISQSGALCTAILDWAEEQRVGFRYFVSIGSMIDVGFHDLIDYFGQDPNSSSILIYMESLTNARKFLSAARAYSRNKPIVILKAGKSNEGAQAARSHTGSIAGNDVVFNAAFKRAGIIRVNTITELFNCAEALAKQSRPRGDRLAIVTNAGGPGVIATDCLIENHGKLAELSTGTIERLNGALPPTWSHGNPVDVLGDADPERYRVAVEACLQDPAVDGVLTILTPQAMTNAVAVANILAYLQNKERKTLLASWMGDEEVKNGQEILEQAQIPEFRTPEDAVSCFLYMHQYSRNLELLYETPANIPDGFTPDLKETQRIINEVLAQERDTLTEYESKRLLSCYELPVATNELVTNERDAFKFGKKLGFPLAMKISSPDILHKTDIGGVLLNITSPQEAQKAYRDMVKSVKARLPGARIQGVLMEPMITRRFEIIIGARKDPIFGPTIIFGTGGVAVEVYQDINIGLPPLNMILAERLMEETKIYKLLRGYRGMPAVDISELKFTLCKFAYLLMDFPEIKEIDINPFSIDEKGGVVVDAKIILDQKLRKNNNPFSHLVICPYPREYVTSCTLNDGRQVTLRPIKPEDEPLEAAMFEKFSEQTQRFRFFEKIKEITHQQLVRFTQIDYDREIAIIAEMEVNSEKIMAGVVRLVADAGNESAEFAIVVADPWQGLGLGNRLTDYIFKIAGHRKISRIYAHVHHQNEVMLHMLKKRGFSTSESGNGYSQLVLDLLKIPQEI